MCGAVREWVAGLVAGGCRRGGLAKAHAVLRQVLASAVKGGRLSRNVAVDIKLPKVQRIEMHFLDAEQVEALAEARRSTIGMRRWSASRPTRGRGRAS
jgi:site-specific recombinase XerC